jgi:predicted transposase/invertase (TIGR01784 family)
MNNSIFLTDADDPIDIRKDNVFKAVFTKNNPMSKAALSKLISALISKEVSIKEILTNEIPVESLKERQIRFDINCKAEDGEQINVEMCFNPDPSEPVRLEYHTGKLFISQDIKGIRKNYKDLKQTYQITILAKRQFFRDKEFFHKFEYYDPIHGVSLNGKTRIITLKLSKLYEVSKKAADEMSVSERWAYYFRYLTDRSKRSKINEILEHEEGIAMASKVLMKISKDEIERARLLLDEKNSLDIQSKIVTAERKAERKGELKGVLKGQTERTNYFLELLNQGLSTEEIKQRLESSNK